MSAPRWLFPAILVATACGAIGEHLTVGANYADVDAGRPPEAAAAPQPTARPPRDVTNDAGDAGIVFFATQLEGPSECTEWEPTAGAEVSSAPGNPGSGCRVCAMGGSSSVWAGRLVIRLPQLETGWYVLTASLYASRTSGPPPEARIDLFFETGEDSGVSGGTGGSPPLTWNEVQVEREVVSPRRVELGVRVGLSGAQVGECLSFDNVVITRYAPGPPP